MSLFRIKKECRSTTVISRSRFIACLGRCETEEEARAYIDQIRKEFPEANHVCTAYIIGPHQEIQRSNDNHEPSGTAGIPMLESLRMNDMTDICACVVRYFGGIKLGAGGLIRAYSGAVSEALSQAVKTTAVSFRKYRLVYPYDLSGVFDGWLRRSVKNPEFSYEAEVTCTFLYENDSVELTIQDLSKGKILPVYLGEEVVEIEVRNEEQSQD